MTGFAKRKQQRREYGAIQLAKKQRIARNAARKEVRHGDASERVGGLRRMQKSKATMHAEPQFSRYGSLALCSYHFLLLLVFSACFCLLIIFFPLLFFSFFSPPSPQRREALKITDRLTGAFGEKHKDDSDDELGEEGQNPEDFEKEQKEKKKASQSSFFFF